MDYRKYSEKYYIRLDKGDEIIASLLEVCEKENIRTAQIQGIGGCDNVVVGVFEPDKKEYAREEVTAMLEMISLDGNITMYEGKPYLHAHASFAYRGKDGRHAVLAGHLLRAVIGLTGEIVLTPADGNISRKHIEELGIRIWDFSSSR